MWSYTSKDTQVVAVQTPAGYYLTLARPGGRSERLGGGVRDFTGAYGRVWVGDFTYEWGSPKLHAAIRRIIEKQRRDLIAAYFGGAS